MNAKRIFDICTAAFAAVAFAGAVHAAEFTYSTWIPPGSSEVSEGMAPFLKRVEADSKGTFKSKIFTVGQMLDQRATLGGVRDQAVDSGFVLAGITPKELPYNALLGEFQSVNLNPLAAAAANNEVFLLDCPQCIAEYKKNNAISLGGHSISLFYLMCTKDLKTADDLKGLRIRAPLRIQRDAANFFGGTPVMTSFPEMVPALQRGQADCTIGNKAWLTTFGLNDIVKTIVTSRYWGSLPGTGLFVVNSRSWDGLSDEVKKSMIRQFPRTVADVTIDYFSKDGPALKLALKKGVKEAKLDAKFRSMWDKFIAGEPERIKEVAKRRGMSDPTPLFDTYKKVYHKWEGIVAKTGMDREKFAQAMWDEIYSKAKF